MSNNKKMLVAYFSCTGVTERVAKSIAETNGADIYEIKPEIPYTSADLNWMDKKSRSSIEMNNSNSRPAISGRLDNMDTYDIIFVGFPIWWYVAPTIVNTFLESYDLSGKTIIPFATSGGSGLGKTEEGLCISCSDSVVWKQGKLIDGNVTRDTLNSWIDSLKLV